ncbi:MAG: hypothetical protein CL424_08445 [Acidimicrobiaceae bacterium]|nr:hypothetical protein [Acidimicrobiaceae bacterium]
MTARYRRHRAGERETSLERLGRVCDDAFRTSPTTTERRSDTMMKITRTERIMPGSTGDAASIILSDRRGRVASAG